MQLPTRKVLTLEAAKEIVEAAKAYGADHGHHASIVVVVDARTGSRTAPWRSRP
jgi:uncharacterized protein GlcG (DUF336 family)